MESTEAQIINHWEYSVVAVAPFTTKLQAEHELNLLGKTGWELVSVSVRHDVHFAWLKRRKEST